jgi:glycosyltransferase involved in cell wall biosynthesis
LHVRRADYPVVRRVLVLAPGELGEHLDGPVIRAWEFAKALSNEYEVTVAANGADDHEREGIPVISSNRRRLLIAAARHDALLAACLPPYLLALHAPGGLLTISDQYDPHEQELAALAAGPERERKLRVQAAIQGFQLRHADLMLCANEHQRAELLRTAGEVLNLDDRRPDPVVVPFGIPDCPPQSTRRPLRTHFPQLQTGDTLVLWWGSPWRWLDAETAVRAFARIAASRNDVKLVITAGRSPNAGPVRSFDATEETRALAEDLGVLGRTVLFYDEWIPYEQRHDYLRDADLGLTLHRHADEARLAARARYMDYLSAELPCVLGRGDQTAAEFEAAGFATLVESPSADSLAATLLALVDDRDALLVGRAAGHSLAAQHRWSAVGAKLRATLAFAPDLARRPQHLALLRDTGVYYAARAVDWFAARS